MTEKSPNLGGDLPEDSGSLQRLASTEALPARCPDALRQAICDSEDVDKICGLYEVAWEQFRSSGDLPKPMVDEYLAEALYRLIPHLLPELVRVDIEQRQLAGEIPKRREYLDPFLGYHDVLEVVLAEMLPAEAIPRPRRLGHYELDGEIGAGGMAVVFRATDLRLGRKVAIKMIRGVSTEEKARILLEAQSIAKLDDQHILKIFESGEIDGTPFLALEYCDGGTLADQLHGTPQQPKVAAKLVATLAMAIQYAHEQGIVHRDLKPANILFGSNSVVKVSDFGLAKHLSNELGHTQSGAILGTPSYMAPEQACGQSKDVGPAADIYSLGAILYESLTGRPPFKAATLPDTLDMVRDQEPVAIRRLQPKVKRDLETICLKCLHKVPARRYLTARDLAEDLECFLKNDPIKARPVSIVEKVYLWLAKRPKPVAAVVIVLVLILFGYNIISSQNRSDRAKALLDSLASIDVEKIPQLIGQLTAERQYFVPKLSQRLSDSPNDEGWRYRLALLATSGNGEHAQQLLPKLFEASPEELLVICEVLRPHFGNVTDQLLEQSSNQSPEVRFRAGCALSMLNPDSPGWANIANDIANNLVRQNVLELRDCTKALLPVHTKLNAPLTQIYRNDSADDAHRTLAANVLVEFNRDDHSFIAELLLDADVKRFAILRPEIAKLDQAAIKRLTTAALPPSSSQEVPAADTYRRSSRRANAALCLLLLNHEPNSVWNVLRHTGNPTTRNLFIHRLTSGGADWHLLETKLRRPDSDAATTFALILALGQFDETTLPATDRETLSEWLQARYREDPNPAVHAAIRWLMEKWEFGPRVAQWDVSLARTWQDIDEELIRGPPLVTPRWAVVKNADDAPHATGLVQTFVLLPAPGKVQMGSQPNDPERDETLLNRETLHWERISRPYAISMHEVTLDAFLHFDPKAKYRPPVPDKDKLRRYPANSTTWYRAMAYCNWLSAQHGIPEEQWSCPSGTDFKTGMVLQPGYLTHTGYRLPTNAEWEYACRAGTTTSRYCGELRLLPEYAWDYTASRGTFMNPVGSRKPNDFGIFDTLGNALEWTINRYEAYPAPGETDQEHPKDDAEIQLVLSELEEHKHSVRGGSFYNPIERVRAAYRYLYQPSSAVENLGFRVVRTLPSSSSSN